tara:strand:+ start:75 stop:491 length:417 start_codon:yes stop_codon:yes gene_type:complete
MKKIILTLACLSLVFVNPTFAHNCANETGKSEEQIHACCKAKGGPENCCKKDLSDEKKQCTKKDCKGACCTKGLDENSKTKCSKSNCDKSKCDKTQCDKSKCDKSKCDKTQCDKSKCDKTKCDKSGGNVEKKSWWKIW